ncbi:MAG: hypothetical protein JWQ81_7792 [Amycolatopsis sp.]|uniref:hypothetical protein n=1 Tax=Amycolatopsis sp. TaxID=37632 RepID=UPI0026213CA5|nr:hypothetical protein [Amycolatopsis sp.]MCU1687053.1 hypothetical protein [Amycolatopsis sp.]
MAYSIIFGNYDQADCFQQAAEWLRGPGQTVINVLAVTMELNSPFERADSPEIHHLALFYNDGNEPPAPVELAAYRERWDREL